MTNIHQNSRYISLSRTVKGNMLFSRTVAGKKNLFCENYAKLLKIIIYKINVHLLKMNKSPQSEKCF